MTQTPLQQLLDLHRDTTDKFLSITVAKNADYTAGSSDPYANFRIAESFGVHPAIGIVLRITDKLQRIRSFALSGEMAVKSESVDDACDDIVNYAILIKGLLRENGKSPSTGATEKLLK